MREIIILLTLYYIQCGGAFCQRRHRRNPFLLIRRMQFYTYLGSRPPHCIQLLYTSLCRRVFPLWPSRHSHCCDTSRIPKYNNSLPIHKLHGLTSCSHAYGFPKKNLRKYRILYYYYPAHTVSYYYYDLHIPRGCIFEPIPVVNPPRLRPVTSINGLSLKTSKVYRSLCIGYACTRMRIF